MESVLEKINCSADVRNLCEKELEQLAVELREYILQVVAKQGGHLAPNLGVIELTIALHKFLHLPYDQIVWDVGHQCYAHKILSGRKEEFLTLRQKGGISGFPKPNESSCDVFVAGHSSTSISVAVGLAQAALHSGERRHVVAVIGDGAMTGGMAYEALNHGGGLQTPFTVILNDNEMSIGKNVGSLPNHLTKLRTSPHYRRGKMRLNHFLRKIPKIGDPMAYGMERMKNSFKYFLVHGVVFEEMGFVYLGPVDGHDIGALLDVLEKSASLNKPTLIHVVTKKGKGYLPAEEKPNIFHGIGSFDLDTGEANSVSGTSYTACFKKALLEEAGENDNIVAITAAMADGTGLNEFAKKYPSRFYDVGIAEQHAITFAGAMASRGYKPVVAIYSTFLQRAYDQIIQDICLSNLPVVLAIDRAGLVGEDGPTHHGLFDMAFLRTMPNMTVMVPRDGEMLKRMTKYALKQNTPMALRYPRGKIKEPILPTPNIIRGKGQILREGEEIGILAVGTFVYTALELADILERELGQKAGVADLCFVKPLDTELLCKWAKAYKHIIILEEGVQKGGVASACLEAWQEMNQSVNVLNCGFPDVFIEQGTIAELYEEYALTAPQIAAEALARWYR